MSVLGGNATSGACTVTAEQLCGKRWNYCPECGTKLEAEWKFCPKCGGAIGQQVSPWSPWVIPTYPTGPQWYPPTITFDAGGGVKKCAFDGLPPGTYGLYCDCPKCSPKCGVNT